MAGPVLAPWPTAAPEAVSPNPRPVLNHSDSEWQALYPEIQRLYVRERRRLRYVVQYMESKHGFKATEQMYKKRFAKWGFQKNSRRPAEHLCASGAKDRYKESPKIRANALETKLELELDPTGSVPALRPISQSDTIKLMFLSRVQTWSISFFESVQFRDEVMVRPQQQIRQHQIESCATQDTICALKLVADLLSRGHGDLAGRMARKAFIAAEDMLDLDGPVLMWNLLEVMHYMVTRPHKRLFQLLLAHLSALSDARMPQTHPLPVMLRGLQRLGAALMASSFSPDGTSSDAWSSSSSSVNDNNDLLLPGDFSFLLEKAWIMNAQVLFDHFDPRLLHIYTRLKCDSCSIDLPARTLRTLERWLRQIEAEEIFSLASLSCLYDGITSTVPAEEELVRHILFKAQYPSLLRDFDILRANCVVALQEQEGDIVGRMASCSKYNNSLLVPVLAWLTTAIILGRAANKQPTADHGTITKTCSYVSRVAFLLEILLQLNKRDDVASLDELVDTVQKLRALVTLRQYAYGETCPKTIRHMWLLQDALVAVGEFEDAQEVERRMYSCIEEYLGSIFVHSV